MDRSHPTYLAIVIVFALILQLVLMWRLRRAIPTESRGETRIDIDGPPED